MQNKIFLGGLIVVLIIALAGLYFAISGPGQVGKELKDLTAKFNRDIQRLSVRTAPYVFVGEPIGYVIEFENGVKFYISGDTGVFAEMKYLIGDYYKVDVAILSIGNYFTMDPKEAAYAASLIKPQKYVIPQHYASFPMLVQDPTEFFNELGKYNLTAQPLSLKPGVEKEVLGVKVVWLSHGSWLFESPKGIRILVDPAAKFSAVWPEEYKDFTKFEKVDLILLTHAHPDHVITSDLEKLAKLYDPIIFVAYELGDWLKEVTGLEKIFSSFNKGANIAKDEVSKMGLPAEKIGGVRIHAVPAEHSTSAMIQ